MIGSRCILVPHMQQCLQVDPRQHFLDGIIDTHLQVYADQIAIDLLTHLAETVHAVLVGENEKWQSVGLGQNYVVAIEKSEKLAENTLTRDVLAESELVIALK